MTSTLLTVVAHAAIMAAPQNTDEFTQAARRSLEEDRPLVVLLGAPWCPGCVKLKDTTMPVVAKSGGLEGVEYVYVNVDKNPQLTRQLAKGNAIPQLIRLTYDEGRWSAKHMIGARSVKEVTTFIQGEKAKKPGLSKLPLSLATIPRIFGD